MGQQISDTQPSPWQVTQRQLCQSVPSCLVLAVSTCRVYAGHSDCQLNVEHSQYSDYVSQGGAKSCGGGAGEVR